MTKGIPRIPDHAPRTINLLDLSGQYRKLRDEINQSIMEVLESGAYIMGPQVRQFEQHLEEFLGVKHAIGVASGSDALLLSLHALGIGTGDRVIVPTFTFFATASAVSRLGATPVFVDINPDTYNMDLNQVEDLLIKDAKIKAIIPVHIFGLPVDMQHLMSLAVRHNLYVVEDACQAINADIATAGTDFITSDRREINEPADSRSSSSDKALTQKAGTIGHTGCFSFFPSKNLGGYGDGGAIVTNSDEIAEKIRILRVHGSNPKYYHSIIGYNSRLDTVQAAILDIKLKYLQEWTDKRRNIAMMYNGAFQDAGLVEAIKTPEVLEGHVFHQYVIEAGQRDRLAQHLKDSGIGTAIYYPLPLHLQHCFADRGCHVGDLPIAEQACKRVLALPIDPELTREQIYYIVNTIRKFIA